MAAGNVCRPMVDVCREGMIDEVFGASRAQ